MHVITGEIRKEPFTREGQGAKGAWKMYAVDFSERYKDKDGNPQYTNYRAVFFANENTRQWYDEAFQQGKVVSISAETLAVNQREKDGVIYITLEPQMPRLVFSQRGGGQSQGQQQSQPRQQQQPRQQAPAPQNQYDDDIPF